MFFFLLLELHYLQLNSHVSKFQTTKCRHRLYISPHGTSYELVAKPKCRKVRAAGSMNTLENVLLSNLLTDDARHIVVARQCYEHVTASYVQPKQVREAALGSPMFSKYPRGRGEEAQEAAKCCRLPRFYPRCVDDEDATPSSHNSKSAKFEISLQPFTNINHCNHVF
jgi:hypothetical protein